MKHFFAVALFIGLNVVLVAQHSVARKWNELVLKAIRNDFARPTVHARNLLHTSVAMYDAWATYDDYADTYFLGNTIGGFFFPIQPINMPEDRKAAQEEAISYAVYRLINHRFKNSPKKEDTFKKINELMQELGYDVNFTSTDYSSQRPAALGNYIAEKIIAFGLQDGSNEANDYANQYYRQVNGPLAPATPGNRFLFDPNRFQPLSLSVAIDQAGNLIPGENIPFLSPEWGNVQPFALTEQDATTYFRRGNAYKVYLDPSAPCFIDSEDKQGSEEYKWNFSIVSVWGSHLDTANQVIWDISPASIGNTKLEEYPTDFETYKNFYDFFEGGTVQYGHAINPKTGQPYEPQLVPRGDYTRVVAEFWADGLDSETPPGHWFNIFNTVSEHPLLEKRFNGRGELLDDLAWDVKGYLILGGAMHDAAIAAWSIKGWYDYVRPISAIRYMGVQGQSTNPDAENYSILGIPLIDNFIEVVRENDPLAIQNRNNIGKIKLYTWRGPDYIGDPKEDKAGVDWILAENWWPYQRPTFVTPPFAGYISGHSTFSRAAAEALTLITGDAYFPGGMSDFKIKKNEYLVFEQGPSLDMTLQWATYRDASDQSSLSRIWGGIHPPIDDIPGRKIGAQVGVRAYEKAIPYFNLDAVAVKNLLPVQTLVIAPNPAKVGSTIELKSDFITSSKTQLTVYNLLGKIVHQQWITSEANFVLPSFEQGLYVVELVQHPKKWIGKLMVR